MSAIDPDRKDSERAPPVRDLRRELEEFLRKEGKHLLQIALRLTRGNNADAQDLIQEAFSQGLKRASPVDSPDNWMLWFRVVMRNHWVNRIRDGTRENAAVVQQRQNFPTSTVIDSPTPQDILIKQEEERRLQAGLRNLSETYRCAILATYFDGMDHNEAAEALGITTHALRTRLTRGRRELRTFLDK